MEALRGKGYRIEAVPARGYRLVEVPDRLTALELSPLLNTRELGRGVHYFESRWPPPTRWRSGWRRRAPRTARWWWPSSRRAGKGRRGRAWVSPPGLNLYFSAILRPELPPQRAPELTLVAAVALAETLREAGARGLHQVAQ